MIIWNRAVDSAPYEKFRWTPRPCHADYPAHVKYGGFNDYRGGGRFSGRVTGSYVMAGAIAKKLLQQTLRVDVLAFTVEIGGIQARDVDVEKIKAISEESPLRCPDREASGKMIKAIQKAVEEGDSLGGAVQCIVSNLPLGIGEPVFDTLEGDISKLLFSIPAVKAVEFGAGRSLSGMRGSESNDQYILRNGELWSETNSSGGILGGISSGMPITCRITIKPTPSIRRPQNSVDLRSMEETVLSIEGQHDPCIVPRAVPVVEAVFAVTLADHALRSELIPNVLEEKQREL